jgi:hypothetical protein
MGSSEPSISPSKMAATTSDDCEGLMAFWADIDDDYVLKYQRWHNCEHVPERVSISGFVEGRRYRAMDNSTHFLMYYDTKSTAVLASDAYMAALNKPTPWTREALTHFRNPTRDVFTRIAVLGKQRQFAAPYLTSVRFDLPEGGEHRYVTVWLQAALDSPNVERVRMYQADSAIGNMGTSERNVHGGGPGKQAFLVFIEQTLPPTAEQCPIARADKALGGPVQRESEQRNNFWLEIAHTKRAL